jgi:hypothetical protein
MKCVIPYYFKADRPLVHCNVLDGPELNGMELVLVKQLAYESLSNLYSRGITRSPPIRFHRDLLVLGGMNDSLNLRERHIPIADAMRETHHVGSKSISPQMGGLPGIFSDNVDKFLVDGQAKGATTAIMLFMGTHQEQWLFEQEGLVASLTRHDGRDVQSEEVLIALELKLVESLPGFL